ncbi:hypothetical protein IAR55_001790 [Kwoniella newhampshirensis]|uniref:GAR domain-containing protein n=1 Tax=Kwoniella newhampshirensis TaxID=1651941 RepID=A0AAW0Z369_9TREE
MRELPQEDARELGAFVEKRRWFESKLKVAVPPLYPFLHPVLTSQSGTDGFLREGVADARWQLPSVDQVQQWQDERNLIEEEVLKFDGGDLERIKTKTRVRSKPLAHKNGAHGLSTLVQSPSTLNENLTVLKTAPSPSNSAFPASPRPTTPRRSLHIPLLHSHIVNLETRYQSLVSTHLARSGVLLDRMMDIAGPLRNLGDTYGPRDATMLDDGAVPEKLLDLQDGIDTDVEDLGKIIHWCKEIEEHYILCDDHYTASNHAQQAADMLLNDLREALERPATSDDHSRLAGLLHTVQALLPSTITSEFPRPSHPAYPDHGSHNDEIVTTLRSAREIASNHVSKARQGVEWYDRLSSARLRLVESNLNLVKQERGLWQRIEMLQIGPHDNPRPDLSNLSSLTGGLDSWLNATQRRTFEANAAIEKCTESCQVTTLAIMQYRTVIKTAPASLRQEMPVHLVTDDLLDQAEQNTGRLLELVRRANADVRAVDLDLLVIPLAQQIVRSGNTIKAESEALLVQIIGAINDASVAQTFVNRSKLDFFEAKICSADQTIKEALTRPLARLEKLVKTSDRSILAIRNHTSLVNQLHHDVKQNLILYQRVTQQADVVRSIQNETTRLLQKIVIIQEQLDSLVQDGRLLGAEAHELIIAQLDSIDKEIVDWQAGLAARVPFIATNGSGSIPLGNDQSSVTSQPYGEHHFAVDLMKMDKTTRDSVNDSSTSVASAIAHCKRSYNQVLCQLWIIDCRNSAEIVDHGLARWESASVQIRDQLEDTSSQPAMVNAIEASFSQLRLVLNEREVDLRQAVGHFRNVVEKRPGTLMQTSNVEVWLTAFDAASGVVTAALAEIEQTKTEARDCLSKARRSLGAAPTWTRSTPHGHDVFGPQSSVHDICKAPSLTNPVVDDALARIRAMRRSLDDLCVSQIVNPTVSELAITHGLRRLPTEHVRSDIIAALDDVSLQIENVAEPTTDSAISELNEVKTTVRACHDLFPALDRLVTFAQAVATCDTKLSRLLEFTDNVEEGQDVPLASLREEASVSVTKLVDLFPSVESDSRAKHEMHRVKDAWDELIILAEEGIRSARRGVDYDGISEHAGVTRPESSRSAAASRLPRLTSSSSRPIHRAASNPTTIQGHSTYFSPAQTPKSRMRAVSETPTRIQVNDERNLGIRNSRNDLNSIPASPQTDGTRLRPSSIPRPVKGLTPATERVPSSPSMSLPIARAVPRSRKNSRLLGLPPQAETEYVADPRSGLDIAVGNIVNKLGVNVPMRPVGLNTSDKWKDQSGKYWIGAEGRAKLCFCRILRSRTVMVRVGGGWVELSKFLLDHFAEAIGSWQTPFDQLSNDLVPVTSASLTSQNHQSVPASLAASSLPSTDETPVYSEIPFPHTPGNQHLSPDKVASPHTPSSHGKTQTALLDSGGANGSPLIAFQFIKRASESPTMREKEKEKFIGRRSILGREREGSAGL